MKNAIEYLKLIGALDENENLTILGGKRDVIIPVFEFMHFDACNSCKDEVLFLYNSKPHAV